MHYSSEMKTQLQISNGVVTGGEYQLTQPFPKVAVLQAGRLFSMKSFCLKLHVEGAGKQKMQVVDPKGCKSSNLHVDDPVPPCDPQDLK